MGEPRRMPGGDLLRKAARVTTGTAVAATEVMVMSLEMTRRVVRRVVRRPARRGPRAVDDDR